jgi:Holliday junction resolvase RusA-like endonuclease
VISFVVEGTPQPKGRPRVDTRGRKPRVYTPDATRTYEELVHLVALQARKKAGGTIRGPVRVDVRFFGARGDVDNLCKTVLDGMRRAAFADDRQVLELHAYVVRRDGKPRAEVVVEAIA